MLSCKMPYKRAAAGAGLGGSQCIVTAQDRAMLLGLLGKGPRAESIGPGGRRVDAAQGWSLAQVACRAAHGSRGTSGLRAEGDKGAGLALQLSPRRPCVLPGRAQPPSEPQCPPLLWALRLKRTQTHGHV